MSENVKPDNGVIRLLTPCNGSTTHEWFSQFSDREVENVSLHYIWIETDGCAFENGERPFVPSFDSKEKDVYILSFTHKEEGRPDISMIAKYDHKTGTGTIKGEGFKRAMFEIKLKPKAE